MGRANVAETLLRAVAVKDRAREITGDLLETYSQAGAISFWLAFTRLFLSFAWKPAAAFLVAVIVSFSFSTELFFVASRKLFTGPVHAPTLLFHALRYAEASAPLWALAVFTILRFGVRDRLWIVSAIYGCLTTGFVYSYWIPQGHLILWIGSGAAVVLSLSTDRMRRATSVIAVVLTLGVATNQFLVFILSMVLYNHFSSASAGTSSLFLLLSVPLVETATCVALHRRIVVEKRLIAR